MVTAIICEILTVASGIRTRNDAVSAATFFGEYFSVEESYFNNHFFSIVTQSTQLYKIMVILVQLIHDCERKP